MKPIFEFIEYNPFPFVKKYDFYIIDQKGQKKLIGKVSKSFLDNFDHLVKHILKNRKDKK
jgi:hypothetical protein